MYKKRWVLTVVVLLFTMSLLAGCNSSQDTGLDDVESVEESNVDVKEDDYGITSEDDHVKFKDGREIEVKISKKPEKVVVLFASFIDIWMNNGGEKPIGIVQPSEEYMTPEIEDIKTVGKRGSISLEEVIALDADLVIVSSNTSDHVEMIPSLEGAGTEVVALDYTYKDDYFKIAKLFATINDELELYETQAQEVKSGIEEIIEKVPDKENPSAAIIMSTKSNTSLRTSKTTLGEMFEDLNVVNIADKENNQEGNKDFSLEKILEEDPDFIFLEIMGSDVDAVRDKIKADVESNPAWGSLSAVKNNNYIILPKDLYSYKANHRYEEAYENLAKTLYPQIFN